MEIFRVVPLLLHQTLVMDAAADHHKVARWVILVAREETELYEHLRAAFRGDPKVRVVLDRRADDSRNSPRVNERLRNARVVVIPVTQAAPVEGD